MKLKKSVSNFGDGFESKFERDKTKQDINLGGKKELSEYSA